MKCWITFTDCFKIYSVIVIKPFIICSMAYVNIKGLDQPEHPCSLILLFYVLLYVHYSMLSN